MTPKNVTILAHYFAPLNVTGAKRPEALAQFLCDLDFEVTVLTTVSSNKKNYLLEDNKVNVVETSIISERKYSGFKRLAEAHNQPNKFVQKIRLFKRRFLTPVFGSLLDARLVWALGIILSMIIQKYIPFLALRNYKFSSAKILISTSPPYTMLLVAYFWKILFKNVFLVLDYRDQFSSNHMFENKLSRIETFLDRLFIKRADLVLCVSQPMKEYYDRLGNINSLVVMNGFATSLISNNNHKDDGKFRYFGTITPDRLMPQLWSALALIPADERPYLEFYGELELLESYLKMNFPSILPFVSLNSPIDHQKAIELMRQSKGLLFTETSDEKHDSQKGVLTTKLFEYFAVNKPIIAIISESTLAGRLIKDSGLGRVVSLDVEKIKNSFYDSSELQVRMDVISEYSRDNQFSKVIGLLPV